MLKIPNSTIESIRKQSEELSEISNDRLYAWVAYGERKSADEFVSYVKRSKLMGNPVHYRTGELMHSIGAVTPTKGKYKRKLIVRPGAGIKGCLNYLNRWVGTPLEFMAPAAREFSAGGRVQRNVKDNIDKMLAKTAKEMSNA